MEDDHTDSVGNAGDPDLGEQLMQVETLVSQLKASFLQAIADLSRTQPDDQTIELRVNATETKLRQEIASVSSNMDAMRADLQSLQSKLSELKPQARPYTDTSAAYTRQLHRCMSFNEALLNELQRKGRLSPGMRERINAAVNSVASDQDSGLPTSPTADGLTSSCSESRSPARQSALLSRYIADLPAAGGGEEESDTSVMVAASRTAELTQSLARACRAAKPSESDTESTAPAAQVAAPRRLEILKQLLARDDDFRADVRTTVQTYLHPVAGLSGLSSSEKRELSLAPLSRVLEEHEAFAKSLRARLQHGEFCGVVGDIVVQAVADKGLLVSVHQRYLQHLPGFVILLQRCQRRSSQLKRFLQRRYEDDPLEERDLKTRCLSPTPRLSEVAIFLQQLLRATEASHPDHLTLSSALTNLSGCLLSYNTLLETAVTQIETGDLAYKPFVGRTSRLRELSPESSTDGHRHATQSYVRPRKSPMTFDKFQHDESTSSDNSSSGPTAFDFSDVSRRLPSSPRQKNQLQKI